MDAQERSRLVAAEARKTYLQIKALKRDMPQFTAAQRKALSDAIIKEAIRLVDARIPPHGETLTMQVLRPCLVCGTLIHAPASRCPVHAIPNRTRYRDRGTRTEQGYGYQWQRLRLVVLELSLIHI